MANFNRGLNEKFLDEVVQLPSYLLDTAVEWAAANLDPEDIFDEVRLNQWAYDNGFKKFE